MSAGAFTAVSSLVHRVRDAGETAAMGLFRKTHGEVPAQGHDPEEKAMTGPGGEGENIHMDETRGVVNNMVRWTCTVPDAFRRLNFQKPPLSGSQLNQCCCRSIPFAQMSVS